MQRELPVRKHPRLNGYDYSSNGAYFLTFCVKGRHEMLGQIVGRDAPGAPFMRLSEYGIIIKKEIEETHLHYTNIIVDNFVIMPNHVHMILILSNDDGAPRAARPTNALVPNLISIMKKKTNKKYGFSMWQTSYHDHIIRNEADYQRIFQYIEENPIKWQEDRYYSLGINT